MKEKGFTLIEVMAVVILLGMIAVVAGPPILNQLKKSQVAIDDATKLLINSAVDEYVALKQYQKLPNDTYCITVEQLLDRGLILESLITRADNPVSEDQIVKVSVDSNQNLSYEYVSPGSVCQE